MLFLARCCKFHTLQRYASVINPLEKCNLCLPFVLNLKRKFPLCSKQFSSNTDLSVSNKNVKRYLDNLLDEYKNNDQSKSNDNRVIDLSNSYSVTALLNEKLKAIENIEALHELAVDDKNMKELVDKEVSVYKQQLVEIDEQLLETVLQNLSTHNYKNIIMEITAGVGGQEAMLFVKDLYNMYIGYLDYLGCSYEVVEADFTEQGGIRKASILISSNKVFDKIKYEGGVHRVQRIPSTERSGRIHTSTASVAVLPEPTDVEVMLNDKDLKIDTMRASGAGGQHVNTTDSAVRITHIPTGTTVTCQAGRSQIKNKEFALTKLRTILYEQQLNTQSTLIGNLRKKQMGMGMRNEKIRTYNYNQDRITDHRLQNGTMHHLAEFMEGGAALEELEAKLHKDMQMKVLLELVEKSESQLK